ncbi:FAD binding domain-containing protein [Aspergillus avenaceus]|uniref:Fumarate reductase n=1 Tax=Aspergillus avenaceus TaxID=36643 RepID=A0A5N6TJZ1_ASPAV|nr:FAD binding domain-containing protein [Aspergillus avenaceus]
MSPIIIVGSGLAGLSAASQILTHNIPVVMLERGAKPGGNSIKASSGINGVPTRFQLDSTDSPALFLSDTVTSAGGVFGNSTGSEKMRRQRLVEKLTGSSGEAVNWLVDEKGVELSRVCQLGGHSCARTHRGKGKLTPGFAIVSSLLESLKGSPLFEMRVGVRVTGVVKEAEEVVGVEYLSGEESGRVDGPVVFASGGFAGDARGLLARYRPDLAGIPSTNQAVEGTQPLLESVGAGLVDMEEVQVHPTGFVDGGDVEAGVKILAAEALRGEGGILVVGGKRFVNELETREHVTGVIMRDARRLETGTRQWDVQVVLDEGAAAALGSHMDFYLWKGLLKKAAVGELEPELQSTLRTYAGVVSGETKDEFGRTAFGHWGLREVTPDAVVYVGQVTPVTHFTMGGAAIDERSRVLSNQGVPIRGLWAAGEVTGGLHGQNRLGGSSLLECVVFGRIAGDEAAAFYKSHYSSVQA